MLYASSSEQLVKSIRLRPASKGGIFGRWADNDWDDRAPRTFGIVPISEAHSIGE